MRFKLNRALNIAALTAVIVPALSQVVFAWPTYLHDKGRSGFDSTETIINSTSAPNLSVKWTYQSTGCAHAPAGSPLTVSSQPVVVDGLGLVFWGSWDGCEHASTLNGSQLWATYLAQTTGASSCNPNPVGVSSTGTYSSTIVHGIETSAYFVGGGDANFYALNAKTGAILWKTLLGSSPSHFIWSSPAIYNGSVYVGVASFGDCPLVRGRLFQMNASSGAIQNIFNVVPSGCTGGGVSSSPTIDVAAGTIYFATGNAGSCSHSELYAPAVVELSASNLGLVGHWQVPTAQQGDDPDFLTTPTLFRATINGSVRKLLGLADKNGIYYAFVRGKVGKGPLWEVAIANGGGCPQCGEGSISPSAWDGSTLYVAGGNTTINGKLCQGSVQALNPANGSALWQNCLTSGPVLGAVTAVPGLAVVGAGPDLVAIATASGDTLFSYTASGGAIFYGGTSISNGVLYVGDTNGNLYAFAP